MKHTEVPRDEEAIQRERDYWSWPYASWMRYDMRGMRRRHTSITEERGEYNTRDEDWGGE